MMTFIAGFAISLGSVMWLMVTEVFPVTVRGLGSSIITSVDWGVSWLVSLLLLPLIKYTSISTTFFIFFIFTVLALNFIYFFIPETKDCTLEEIEANLQAGKSCRHLGKSVNKPAIIQPLEQKITT